MAGTMSPLMEQINNGNWLPQQEAESLRDEFYYQNAVQAYVLTIPILNTIGLRDGSEDAFGKNVIGMFTDFYQRTITDVGAVGPDGAKGGLYLLLPPDYKQDVPKVYFAFKSSTNNVFLFFRTIMPPGDDGPEPAPAVANAEETRIYPLWASEKDVKPMEFPNGSGKHINMMYPTDNSYWTKLKAFVDYEPVESIDPVTRGILASVGIIKGFPFEPNDKQNAALQRAVEASPRMILAGRQLGWPDKRDLYYKDRQYLNTWAGATAEWMQDSYLDVIQRASYFQVAYSSSPAMVMRTIDLGSKYPFATRDANGEFLDGSNSYKLHLPPQPPAAQFWAVTAYNITDGTMTAAEQFMPSVNALDKVDTNSDGSVDLYFGPSQPAGAPDSNWIQTVDGLHFLATVRLYGAGVEFFDQTWKPDDLVKLE
ncbi:hypothetical protein FE257_008407 [Aspergillus nanangensis]|uniref:DUF1254 domain-containing protein n=1 Tax=Aspergillus nanangensis TaxID=2582783 RepID=A0AAD4CLC7_ASPNN|nr:hypothetical protein FE257_008407 [Aspergillus nanangensis]